MSQESAYIVSACRSAIGTLHGGLGSMTAPQLGAQAIKEAIRRSGIEARDIDEVIMGQVVQGGSGQARRVRRRSTAACRRRSGA